MTGLFQQRGLALMLLFLCLLVDPAVGDVLADEPLTLKPCPSSPNCVSSLAADPGRRIEPLPVYGSGCAC